MRTFLRAHKKLIIFTAVMLLLAICSCVCLGVYLSLPDRLVTQSAAKVFRGESKERFAQVTAFFPVDGGIAETDIYTFRKSADSSLLASSLEAPEGGALYDDGWSARGSVSVTGDRGTFTVDAIGVGGDFFRFHPLQLRDGSYISGDDLMHDRVVLDEELAWRLFGGVELTGMHVVINDAPYVVAGVVSREDDKSSEKAWTVEGGGLFMAYDRLNGISETKISCYELVCADPISDFALDVLKSGFPSAVCVENSSRFSADAMFKMLRGFGDRSMNTAGVVFPYWENAARLTEDWCALYFFLFLFFAAAPLVALITVCVILLRRLWRNLRTRVPEAYLQWRDRRYEQKHGTGNTE